MCERDASRLVNAVIVVRTLYDGKPTGPPQSSNAFITSYVHSVHTVKRKTITIREDQDEWIEENHLNLSSFIRDQLDQLIEERE